MCTALTNRLIETAPRKTIDMRRRISTSLRDTLRSSGSIRIASQSAAETMLVEVFGADRIGPHLKWAEDADIPVLSAIDKLAHERIDDLAARDPEATFFDLVVEEVFGPFTDLCLLKQAS
ncbi:MAG: hypothetical protein LPL29_13355 [Alphaproteobacteria bacterium]|nr:hypothetical protein [Alphaproteobacteria bacterium]